METVLIRNETENDFAVVEHILRESFWNLYVPGCDEHYLAHIMREHPDFIPELDFVIELNGQVIGTVMYTKSELIDESGRSKQILTFGPICITPKYQRRGYGKALLEYSFHKATAMGYDLIVIFGNPDNYVSREFKSCKKHNICLENGEYPFALLVKELKPAALDGRKWIYHESSVYCFDSVEAQKFDALFEPKERKYQPSQEAFYIQSHSVMQ